MSKTTIPQSIFGDQTNIKKCVQPPGGTSSIVFGGEIVKSDAVKCKNRQASDIFNLDENKGATKRPGHFQQEDTKSRLFGDSVKLAKGDSTHKIAGFNPITGEIPQDAAGKEEEDEKKDGETMNNTTVSSAITKTAAAAATAMPPQMKHPPGGKSTKLW